MNTVELSLFYTYNVGIPSFAQIAIVQLQHFLTAWLF